MPVLDAAVPIVLGQLQLAGPWTFAALGAAGGFSGARLWRVTASDGEFCLKAWPEHIDRGWLQRVHGWMSVAQSRGLPFVPRVWQNRAGESCIAHAGRVWDLVEWLPGKSEQRPSTQQLESACTALARLHLVWEQCEPGCEVPESVRRRLHVASKWQAIIQSGWQPDWEACPLPAAPTLQRIWRRLPAQLPQIPELLMPWTRKRVTLFPCLCDVWNEHVLFAGEAVAGIIDYGSMRIDTPAADLARLLGSYENDAESLWRVGVTAYRRIRELSQDEEWLAHLLDKTGTVLSAASWLDWLVRTPRPFDDYDAVAKRTEALAKRMESLEH